MINTGKAWAAVRDEQVAAVISMRIPNDCDFDLYRKKAMEALEVVGTVKSGEVVLKEDHHYFVQRLNHQNRSKKPREPKVYKL